MTSSETKRTADAVEGLDRAEIKKPKLDADAEPGSAQAQTEEVEDELPEEAMEEPAQAAMEVDDADVSAEPKEPKIRFKKGKTTEGASAHFKENPYTFIAPDDPIVTACVCVAPFCGPLRRPC